MATRVEGLRSQVQDIVKQAVVQMQGVGSTVRAVAERLDLDINAVRERRDAVLRGLDDMPLPEVVRSTIGRVNHLLDAVMDTLVEDQDAKAAPTNKVAREPESSADEEAAAPKATAKTARRGSGSGSRPRKSSGKSGARKPRRQPTTN